MIVRNIIILAGMLAVAIYFALIFSRKWKSFSGGERFFQIGLLVLWLIIIGVPNFPVLFSLFTFPIEGKVIDSTTKKPIANCNIIASWETQTVFIAGARNDTYHQYITKTDANGKYQIPRYIKPLSIIDIGIIRNGFGGVYIAAYIHDYSPSVTGFDFREERTALDLELHETNPEYVDHYISKLEAIFNSKNYKKMKIGQHLSYGIMSYDEIYKDDKRYILDECRLLDTKLREHVKTNKYRDTMLSMEALGRYYEKLGELEAAADVRKRTNEIFPDRDKVKSFVSEENVQLFKRLRKEGKL